MRRTHIDSEKHNAAVARASHARTVTHRQSTGAHRRRKKKKKSAIPAAHTHTTQREKLTNIVEHAAGQKPKLLRACGGYQKIDTQQQRFASAAARRVRGEEKPKMPCG